MFHNIKYTQPFILIPASRKIIQGSISTEAEAEAGGLHLFLHLFHLAMAGLWGFAYSQHGEAHRKSQGCKNGKSQSSGETFGRHRDAEIMIMCLAVPRYKGVSQE